MLWSRWEAPVIPSGVLLVQCGLRPDYTFSFESWREADVPRGMPQAADVQMCRCGALCLLPFFWATRDACATSTSSSSSLGQSRPTAGKA